MNCLIVYAHPEPKSMNGALKDAAVDVLGRRRWNVEVSDLYTQRFQASASREDFTRLHSPAHFGYVHEQRRASAERNYSADILAEQDKLARAQLVIFQFPVWWYSVPAILKGWADRVLTHGFAYDEEHIFQTGLLRGKRAMISMTTGGTEQELIDDSSYTGVPEEFIRPFSGGVLQFVGFDLHPTFICYAAGAADKHRREQEIERFRSHLESVAGN